MSRTAITYFYSSLNAENDNANTFWSVVDHFEDPQTILGGKVIKESDKDTGIIVLDADANIGGKGKHTYIIHIHAGYILYIECTTVITKELCGHPIHFLPLVREFFYVRKCI